MKKVACVLFISSLPLLALAHLRDNEGDGENLSQNLPSHATWMIYAALLISAIALGLQLIPRKSSKPRDGSLNSGVFSDIQLEFTRLRADLNSRIGRIELNSLVEKVNVLEEKINQLERPIREIEWTGFAKSPVSPEADACGSLSQESAQAEQGAEVWFAKLADLEDGFSSGILSTVQNGEQVYEIQTNGDTAVYRISSNPSAQKYALAESAFTLGKACDLLNQPFKGCHIALQKEGILVNTSGNWIIQQKAKIEFK